MTVVEMQFILEMTCVLGVIGLFLALVGFAIGYRVGRSELQRDAAMDVIERASNRNLPSVPPSSGQLP